MTTTGHVCKVWSLTQILLTFHTVKGLCKKGVSLQWSRFAWVVLIGDLDPPCLAQYSQSRWCPCNSKVWKQSTRQGWGRLKGSCSVSAQNPLQGFETRSCWEEWKRTSRIQANHWYISQKENIIKDELVARPAACLIRCCCYCRCC